MNRSTFSAFIFIFSIIKNSFKKRILSKNFSYLRLVNIFLFSLDLSFLDSFGSRIINITHHIIKIFIIVLDNIFSILINFRLLLDRERKCSFIIFIFRKIVIMVSRVIDIVELFRVSKDAFNSFLDKFIIYWAFFVMYKKLIVGLVSWRSNSSSSQLRIRPFINLRISCTRPLSLLSALGFSSGQRVFI